ncbi:hypothetical protein [Lacrimispora sp.]|uniref:hypothetical protein n=1 Tax=Lacrimispora sp. TaxID=2719234 RepID=UPI003460772B
MKRLLSLLLSILIFTSTYSVEGYASTDSIVHQKEDSDSKITVVHKGTVPVDKNQMMQHDEDGEQIFASTYAITLEKKKSATVLDTTGSYRFIATVYYSVKYLDPTNPLDKRPFAKLVKANLSYQQLDHVAYLTSFNGGFTQTGITESGGNFDESIHNLTIPLNYSNHTKTFNVPSYFEYISAHKDTAKALTFWFEFDVAYRDGSSPETVNYTISIDSI